MIFGKEYLSAKTATSLKGLNSVALDLNFNDVYKKINLKMVGTVNVTTAGATVIFNDYAWYSLINSIKLQLNSSNIFEWKPFIFNYIDSFLTENQVYQNVLPTATDMETVGTYSFAITIPIHLNQPKVADSTATLLPILKNMGVNDASLKIDFNGLAEPFASTTGTLPIYSVENLSFYLEVDKVISGEPTFVGSEIKINQFTSKSVSINGAIGNQKINLPANKIYRGFVIESLTTGTLLGADTVIDSLSIYIGNDEIYKNIAWLDFKDNFLKNYNSAQLLNNTGRVFVDFAYEDKTLANVVSTMDNYNVNFVFKFASAGLINFYYWTFA